MNSDYRIRKGQIWIAGNLKNSKLIRKKVIWKEIRRYRVLCLMMLPFLVLFFAFSVWPVLQAIFYSFTDYNILQRADFVGLRNYRELLFKDKIFLEAIKNTFIIAVIVGPGGYILAYLLAWLINELPHWLGTILTVFSTGPPWQEPQHGIQALSFPMTVRISEFTAFKPRTNRRGCSLLSDRKTVLWIVILVSYDQPGCGFCPLCSIKGVEAASMKREP